MWETQSSLGSVKKKFGQDRQDWKAGVWAPKLGRASAITMQGMFFQNQLRGGRCKKMRNFERRRERGACGGEEG